MKFNGLKSIKAAFQNLVVFHHLVGVSPESTVHSQQDKFFFKFWTQQLLGNRGPVTQLTGSQYFSLFDSYINLMIALCFLYCAYWFVFYYMQ